MKTLLSLLWRVLRSVSLVLAALVLLIEEWGWRPLTAWAGNVARWPPLARLESRIKTVSPRVALALFLVPALLLLPVKLLALWFINEGRAMLGISVIVLAKLLGTALVGRLFFLLEAQLMTFGWFARSLGWWRATRARILAGVQRSAVWRAAGAARRRCSDWFRRRAARHRSGA